MKIGITKKMLFTCAMLLMTSVLSASNFTINKIDHIVLRVPEKSKADVVNFYISILGLNLEREVEEVNLLQLRAGSSLIDLIIVHEEKMDLTNQNVDHFCLEISTQDIFLVREELLSNGVEITTDVVTRYGAGGYGNSLYILDPIGNTVELKAAPLVT
jgi:extradiol dioxygenase family protein